MDLKYGEVTSLNTRIYVAGYKKSPESLEIINDKDLDNILIPIHCGKAYYDAGMVANGLYCELGDNTGDNISSKNVHYSEITGLYWIWKNDASKPNDIVGFEHYRRFFIEPETRDDESPVFLSKKSIAKYMKEFDFILHGMSTEWGIDKNPNWSVYQGYKDVHVIADLDLALDYIKSKYPSLYPTMYECIQGTGMARNNIFIARKKHLDEYCEFLFDIIDYLESKINMEDGLHDGFNIRIYGFLAERLLYAWIYASGHSAICGEVWDLSDRI